MIELTRTNDPVLLSWLTCQLEQDGIVCMVFDTHTSILEGSIGAIPRRVMVLEEQEAEARQILEQAASYDDARGDGVTENSTSDPEATINGNWGPDPMKT